MATYTTVIDDRKTVDAVTNGLKLRYGKKNAKYILAFTTACADRTLNFIRWTAVVSLCLYLGECSKKGRGDVIDAVDTPAKFMAVTKSICQHMNVSHAIPNKKRIEQYCLRP